MGSDETDSIAIMKIWVPEEVDSIYLTLANREIDSVKDIYSLSPMPLERGHFLSCLKPHDQEMLLQRIRFSLMVILQEMILLICG